MRKWSEVQSWAQWVISVAGAITIIGGSLITAHAYFETSANAKIAHDEIKAEHVQYVNENSDQLISLRVQQIEQLIAGYRYQLLSTKLSSEQRQWLEQEIVRLNAEIACIRAGSC